MFGRRLRRTAAPLLLLAWIGGLALPVLGARHTSLFDDPACERPIQSSTHSGPQFDKDVRQTGDGHCGSWHLQRAVRSALRWVVLSPLYVQAVTFDRVVAQCDLFSSEHAVASSRAPPSAFLIS